MASRLDLLAKEHYHAIGNVTVRASQLEWQIEKTVYQGLRAQPETARFLLRNLSADRMRKLMRAVLSDVLPERATEISTLVNDIERVLDERHEIVHWLWGPPDEADIAPHVSARPTREPQVKKKSSSDIRRIADEAVRLSELLISLQNALHERLQRT